MAVDLPCEAAEFTVVWTQHASARFMDKQARMYAEMRRALVAGGRLAFFDVLTGERQPLHLPVPWAGDDGQLSLATPEELRAIVAAAGFAIRRWDDVTDAAADYVAAVLRTTSLPSELGPQIVVPDMAGRAAALLGNAAEPRHLHPMRRRRGVRFRTSTATESGSGYECGFAGDLVDRGREGDFARPARPRRTLTTSPSTMNSPPHTERFAAQARARHRQRTVQRAQIALARAASAGFSEKNRDVYVERGSAQRAALAITTSIGSRRPGAPIVQDSRQLAPRTSSSALERPLRRGTAPKPRERREVPANEPFTAIERFVKLP